MRSPATATLDLLLDSAQTLGETSRPVVRVIAGAFRGRRLVAPPGRDTRPTSDRVREALFMTLEPLTDLRVIDLFAGSGAMGIEALSRGARWVDFVESGRAPLRALERNLKTLGIEDRTSIWRIDLPRGLKRLAGPILEADLILLDPPYGGALARSTLNELAALSLRSMARVVVEHHAKDEMPQSIGQLLQSRVRRYGETGLTIYGGRAPDPEQPERRNDDPGS